MDRQHSVGMRRFAVLLPVVLALFSLSCGGGVFFVSTDGHDVSFFTVSGAVSIVQLTFVSNRQITVVTLLNNGAAQTFNFCGNVVNQFPVDAFVTVRFTNSSGCSNPAQVIIS